MSIIGTTKVTQGGKLQLISDVRKLLDVNIGDVIVFEKNEKDEIIIRKG